MKSIVMLLCLFATTASFAKPIMATDKELFAELTRRSEKNVTEVSEAFCTSERTYTSYEDRLSINQLNLKSGEVKRESYGVPYDYCSTVALKLNNILNLGDDQTHSIEFSSKGHDDVGREVTYKFVLKATNGNFKVETKK